MSPSKQYSNLLFMPLGYMKGMFNGMRTIHSLKRNDGNNNIKQTNKVKLIANNIDLYSNRTYIWSFIGNYDQKRDRPQMIEHMKTLGGNYYLDNQTKPESKEYIIEI